MFYTRQHSQPGTRQEAVPIGLGLRVYHVSSPFPYRNLVARYIVERGSHQLNAIFFAVGGRSTEDYEASAGSRKRMDIPETHCRQYSVQGTQGCK